MARHYDDTQSTLESTKSAIKLIAAGPTTDIWSEEGVTVAFLNPDDENYLQIILGP